MEPSHSTRDAAAVSAASDAVLLTLMAQRHTDTATAQRAWGEFYHRHRQYLYHVACKVVMVNASDRSDLVQETFLRVFEKAHTLIDAVIAQALATLDEDGHFASEGYGAGAELADEDKRQADALLFVSVTRAKRAVVVSYATSTSGTPRSRPHVPVELLTTWQEAQSIPTTQLPSVAPLRQQFEIPTVWGGHTRQALGSHTLRQERCAIRTYLTDFLGVRFPLHDSPLYPIFYSITRAVLAKIVLQAQARGRPLDTAEGRALFVTDWAGHPSGSGHPHHPIYATIGEQYAERFALAYDPQPRAETFLDLTVREQQTAFPLRLELVTLYQAAGGDVVTIAFRPEALADKTNATGLRWGDFRTHRTPFVVLKRLYPTLRPSVFSGEDGRLYPFIWPADRYLAEEHCTLGNRVNAFARGVFIQQVREWDCDHRCDCRLACPYWMSQ